MLQANPHDTRLRLLRAALEIAQTQGVDAVSTRAVCAAAGVKAPSLYHHFGDRAGLIRAVLDDAFEQYFSRKVSEAPSPGADPRSRVAAGWDAHVAFARAYPGLYPAMYPTHGPASSHVERSGALLHAGFAELEQAGALRDGVDAAQATAALRAALRGVAHAVAADPEDGAATATSALVRDALIDALIGDTAGPGPITADSRRTGNPPTSRKAP